MALLSVIRRWHFREKLSIREISRRTKLSRNTISKYLNCGVTKPRYPKRHSPSQACHADLHSARGPQSLQRPGQLRQSSGQRAPVRRARGGSGRRPGDCRADAPHPACLRRRPHDLRLAAPTSAWSNVSPARCAMARRSPTCPRASKSCNTVCCSVPAEIGRWSRSLPWCCTTTNKRC